MILYINGSPKLKNSNSDFFLNKINKKTKIFYVYKDKFNKILKDIKNNDTIVFSFPLYVDAPTNKIIELLEYIQDNKIDIKNKMIYTIINCGFWEAKHNKTASLIMEEFAINNKAKYMGTFNIGAGEIIGKCGKKKIYKIISIPFLFKIRKFKRYIFNKKKINLETTIRPMTKKLYIYLANCSWKSKMIKNGCYKNN